MPRRFLPLDDILALLERTPVRIAEVTSGLRVAELQAAPTHGEWSVREVLAHLRGCADSIAVHERAHLKQIERAARAVYALRADASRR